MCKYWLLSRKINNVMHKVKDDYIVVKASVLIFVLIGSIISSNVLEFLMINIKNVSPKYPNVIKAYYSLPPFLNIAVLTHSFCTLNKCNSFEQTISKKQIVYQIIANLAFAIGSTTYLYIPQEFKYGWYVIVFF